MDYIETVTKHIVADCRGAERSVLAVNPDVGSHQNLPRTAGGGASSFACSPTILRSAGQCSLRSGMLLPHMAALPGSHSQHDGMRRHPLCQNLVPSVGGDLRPPVAGQTWHIEFAVLESPEHCHNGLADCDQSDGMPYRVR